MTAFAIQPIRGERWAVVLKRDGSPDEFMVDTDGRVRVFNNATDALVAAQAFTGAGPGTALAREAREWRAGRRR